MGRYNSIPLMCNNKYYSAPSVGVQVAITITLLYVYVIGTLKHNTQVPYSHKSQYIPHI